MKLAINLENTAVVSKNIYKISYDLMKPKN